MMATQTSILDKELEKRMIQLEERVDALETEINRLKSKLDSHYIE